MPLKVVVPEVDLAKIRRYAASKFPFHLGYEVCIEVEVSGRNVTILECRAPLHSVFGPDWTRQRIAQLRYDITTKLWTLYCADRNEGWRCYGRVTAVRYVAPFLDELADDPSGIFWG